MTRLCAIFALVLTLTATIALAQGGKAPAAGTTNKSDRELAGLKGPVTSVIVKTAQYTQNGTDWTPGFRKTIETMTFDGAGRYTEHAYQKENETGLSKTSYRYDQNGFIVDERNTDSSGNQLKISRRYDNGVLKGMSENDANGLHRSAGYTYNPNGQVMTEAIRLHKGSEYHLQQKNTFSYNDKGVLTGITEIMYDEKETIVGKNVITLDGKGRRTKVEMTVGNNVVSRKDRQLLGYHRQHS